MDATGHERGPPPPGLSRAPGRDSPETTGHVPRRIGKTLRHPVRKQAVGSGLGPGRHEPLPVLGSHVLAPTRRGETGWLLKLNDRPQEGLCSPHVWLDPGIAGSVPSPPPTPPALCGTRRIPTVQQGADRPCPCVRKASAPVCRHGPLPKPCTLWLQEVKLPRQLATQVRAGPAPLLVGEIQEAAVLC